MDLSQEEWKRSLESDDNAILLDVRTTEEFKEGHIPGAKLLDIRQAGDFMKEIQSMDTYKNYYVYCRSGARSAQACKIMGQIGIPTTYNLLGGFMEWDGATK
jgi:rhodanese-related sulfurtransferase